MRVYSEAEVSQYQASIAPRIPTVAAKLLQMGSDAILLVNDYYVLTIPDAGSPVLRHSSISVSGLNTDTPAKSVRVCCDKTVSSQKVKFTGAEEPGKANGLAGRYFLRLVTCKDGSIRIVAVSPSGQRIPHGNLVKLKADGDLYFYHTVNPELGIKLDVEGRMIYQ